MISKLVNYVSLAVAATTTPEPTTTKTTTATTTRELFCIASLSSDLLH